MRVLVFEWMLGGGGLVDRQTPDLTNSIWRQGIAMGRAIATDFQAAGCEVLLPVDGRLPAAAIPCRQVQIDQAAELPHRLRELAVQADHLFLIAPETEGRLGNLLGWVEECSEKLLSPGRSWIELCADKHHCLNHLAAQGITVPRGMLWRAGHDYWPPSVSLPAILKPNDGCGGEHLRELAENWGKEPTSGAWRAEHRVVGVPLSVVAVAGPKGSCLLHPTHQRFAAGKLGDYVGGELVSDPIMARMAREEAAHVLAALPGMHGIFGFDLVVDRHSESTTLIEVNPRLTSSYLGLRKVYRQNFAAVLLGLFQHGEKVVPVLDSGQQGSTWSLGD
jgi:hypothetical protein